MTTKEFANLISWFEGHMEGSGLMAWHMQSVQPFTHNQPAKFRFWIPPFGWELNVVVTKRRIVASIYIVSVGYIQVEETTTKEWLTLEDLNVLHYKLRNRLAYIDANILNAQEYWRAA